MKKNKILSVILARGGSKGIPNKNICNLGGKPLITYTIEAALNSTAVNRTIVSTDCDEIAKISTHYGADVPFRRPSSLSNDKSSSIDAIIHCLKWLKENEGYVPDYVCLLQCTSPFRTALHIDEAFAIALQNDADSVVSVCANAKSPYWMKIIENGKFKDIFPNHQDYKRRQDLPTTYHLNGAVYINRTSFLYKTKSFFNDDTFAYIMDKTSSIDIDEEIDLLFAEFLLKNMEASYVG